MKNTAFLLALILALFLGACDDSPAVENKVGAEEASQVEERDVSDEETEEEEEEEDITMTPEVLLDILQESFGDDYDVTYDETDNAMMFMPTNDAFITMLDGLDIGDDPAYEDAWESITQGMVMQSEMANSVEDLDYMFVISNPVNEDNVLLVIANDEIVYDFSE